LERRRIDVIRRLGGVCPRLEDVRDRSAAELFAQHRLQLRLEAADVVRQLDDGLEEAVVEGPDFDGVMRAVAFGGGVSESGHADDHAWPLVRSIANVFCREITFGSLVQPAREAQQAPDSWFQASSVALVAATPAARGRRASTGQRDSSEAALA